MKTTTRKMIVLASVTAGVGTVLANSSKIKQYSKRMHERYVVKRFILNNINKEELLSLIKKLNDKQIHFLYQMINSLNRLKEGIHIENNHLQMNKKRIIQQIENYLNQIGD